MFDRVGDELINDQSQRNRSIGVELNSLHRVEIELAVRGPANGVRAHLSQIRAKIDVLEVRVIR